MTKTATTETSFSQWFLAKSTCQHHDVLVFFSLSQMKKYCTIRLRYPHPDEDPQAKVYIQMPNISLLMKLSPKKNSPADSQSLHPENMANTRTQNCATF